jgi:acyl-CoA reductase-like NAD-dependent aldehyde dehydrogenase
MSPLFNVREERIPVELPVLGVSPATFEGQVKNLSLGGAMIETATPFGLRTALVFKLPLDGVSHSFLGRVVRRDSTPVGASTKMGVQFLDLDAQALAHLEAYLKKAATPRVLLAIQQTAPFRADAKLFIGGCDVDTGVYGYMPDASHLIRDYRGTIEALERVKAGESAALATGVVYGRYCIGSSEHNQLAMEAAYKASRVFRHFPLAKRRAMMDSVRRLLIARRDELLDIMIAEGHACELAEWEYEGMCKAYDPDTLDFYHHSLARKIATVAGGDTYIVRRPDGVVAVSPPASAPTSVAIIAGFALFGGNTLVVKPPVKLPLSCTFLWKEIFNEAARMHGAPDGVINVVVGNSTLFTQEWIQSEYVNDILFFGPSHLGLEIGKRAYEHGKKPILELSGSDIMMVWKDADLEGAVKALLDGFWGSTQIGMAPKKTLVHEDIYPQFLERFVEAAKTLRPGLPEEKGVYLSPMNKIQEFYECLKDALSKGGRMVCGGRQLNYLGDEDPDGPFIEPTVVAVDDLEQALTMKCVLEENGVALIPVIKIAADGPLTEASRDDDIFAKMMAALDNNDYGLRTSVWVKSDAYREKFMDRSCNSGMLIVNARHAALNKFLAVRGGVKKSGGPFGEMNYVWEKTTYAHGIFVGRA